MADTTHTVTALYRDAAAAERAAERLRAVGIPEHRIERFTADSGDIALGDHIVPGGLLGALNSLLAPEHEGKTGASPSVVIVASHVPAERLAEARAALGEEAVEVDDNGRD